MQTDESKPMTGKEAMLIAFDRVFDRAASKLQLQCSADDKAQAKQHFADRFSALLDAAAQVTISEIPEAVLRTMEEAIDQLSPAQVVGSLAAIPIAHKTQEMLRSVAYQAAHQRLLEHLINQADTTYGGN